MIVDMQNGMLHCSTYEEWLRLVKHVYSGKKIEGETLVFQSQDDEHMLITSYVVKDDGNKYTLGSFAHDNTYCGYVYCMNSSLVTTGPYDDKEEKGWRKEFLKDFNLQY